MPPREPRPERVAAHLVGLSAESRAAPISSPKATASWRGASEARSAKSTSWRAAGLLVFVEVKARSTLDGAAESLLARQQHRIAAAAGAWLAAHPEDAESDIRFDAVLVAPGRIPRHIPAAFETD